MKEYFVDLNPGDVYALTFMPGLGIEFSYNGEHIGLINDELLARALFSIWIGDRPFDRNIRDQLVNANYEQLT